MNGSPTTIDLRANDIEVHLLYAFLLSGFRLRPELTREQLRGAIASAGLNLSDKGEARISRSGDIDPGDSTLDPYLSLPYLSITISDCIKGSMGLSGDGNEKGIRTSDVKYTVTLMESGQGTVDIQAVFDHPDGHLDVKSMVHLASLGSSSSPEWRLCVDGDDGFPFSLYSKLVEAALKALSGLLGEELRWKELSILDGEKKRPFQNPFPVMAINLPSDIYARTFLSPSQAKLIYPEMPDAASEANTWKQMQASMSEQLLTVLSRSKASRFPDLSFPGRFGYFQDSRLVNMCSTSAVFLHVSPRSAIAVRCDAEETASHATYIIRAFIETMKCLRSQWYTYAIQIQRLDKIIDDLSRDHLDSRSALEVVTSVAEIRREVAASLRDPISLRFASGSLNAVHAAGLAAFQIERLEQIFAVRFEMTEKLYADKKETTRLHDMGEFTRRIARPDTKGGD